MTDVFPSDDEMISSYLDGEATPAEIARVEASPKLVARASDLRAAIAFAAAPVDSLDVGIVDNMLAAALDAGDLPDNVTDLATARPRALPKAILVAAAVVLVALAIPAVRLMNRSSGSSYSASAPTAVADSADGAVAESLGADEAQNKELSPSATTTAAATTAIPSLDFAPADLADPSGATESGIAPPTARLVIPGLPSSDPATFDPLPEVLAPVTDLAALQIVLNRAFTAQSIPAPAASADSGVVGLDPTACAGAVADFLASNAIGAELAAPTAVADFARVSVGGAVHWLGLVRLSPTRAIALVVDSTTCTPVNLIDVTP